MSKQDRLNRIESMIQTSLRTGQEKVAAALAADPPPPAPTDDLDKLASNAQVLADFYEKMAEDPSAVIEKISAAPRPAGSKNPNVSPPDDEESLSVTEGQKHMTTDSSPHAAQKGTDTVPGTDVDMDVHKEMPYHVVLKQSSEKKKIAVAAVYIIDAAEKGNLPDAEKIASKTGMEVDDVNALISGMIEDGPEKGGQKKPKVPSEGVPASGAATPSGSARRSIYGEGAGELDFGTTPTGEPLQRTEKRGETEKDATRRAGDPFEETSDKPTPFGGLATRPAKSAPRPAAATRTKSPQATASKMAGTAGTSSDGKDESSPKEYSATDDGKPVATTIPFLKTPQGATNFTKRQAKMVSAMPILQGLFKEQPYSDPCVNAQFEHTDGSKDSP